MKTRKYLRKRFDISDKVRYDLKVMDYGLCERFTLKKYIKQADGKWSGEAGCKIVLDSLSDNEILEMLTFMEKNILKVRKEQLIRDHGCVPPVNRGEQVLDYEQ